MVELIKEKRGTEGKQLEEVKMEFINEGLKEIWKEKETEIRMFEKNRCKDRTNGKSANEKEWGSI